jgi:hypothetical protein
VTEETTVDSEAGQLLTPDGHPVMVYVSVKYTTFVLGVRGGGGSAVTVGANEAVTEVDITDVAAESVVVDIADVTAERVVEPSESVTVYVTVWYTIYALLDRGGPLGAAGCVGFRQYVLLVPAVGTTRQSPELEAVNHPGDNVHLNHVSYHLKHSRIMCKLTLDGGLVLWMN